MKKIIIGVMIILFCGCSNDTNIILKEIIYNQKVTFEILRPIISAIVSTNKVLKNVVTKQEKQNKAIEQIIYENRKPSYQYMKERTVYLLGDAFVWDDTYNLPSEEAWGGTGSIIKIDDKYTYILTNKHVAGGDNPTTRMWVLSYWNINNKLWKAKKQAEILAKSPKYDLALIRVPGKLVNKKAIPTITTAKIADKAYVVGHHLGRPYVYGEGMVAGYDVNDLIVQLPTLYGNSGSAVFNQDGEIIAVVFAISGSGFVMDTAHALCVDGDDVKQFVEDYFKNQK